MYKHLSAGVVSIEEKSGAIKERNEFIKAGKYEVLDGGICAAGDIIVCGPDYESAAEYLKPFLTKCTDVEDHVEQMTTAEEMYDVQIWDTTDFDLEKVLEMAKEKKHGKINPNDYYLTEDEADEAEEAYIVFEEDKKGNKLYDLSHGAFSNLEAAKKYADSIHEKEDLFVANYKDYMEGNYNYLYELREN